MYKCNILKLCFITCKTFSEGALGCFLLSLLIKNVFGLCCIFIACYGKNIYICGRKP